MAELGALLRSCHPIPSAAVTVVATVFGAAAGNSAGTCVVIASAVLAGQLSIGWSNDRIDVHRDRCVGHPGKPLAAAEISLRVVDVAIAMSVVATCALSFLLGWRAAAVYLAAVAAAWSYNAWLKATVWSWLPYMFAFAMLPAVGTLPLPAHPWPYWWIMVAAALLGAAVNFANAVPELATHPHSDVHGLPDRIGARRSLVATAVLIIAAQALITWAQDDPPGAALWIGAAVVAALVLLGVSVLWTRPGGRRPFYWLLVVAPVQLLVLVITARPLH